MRASSGSNNTFPRARGSINLVIFSEVGRHVRKQVEKSVGRQVKRRSRANREDKETSGETSAETKKETKQHRQTQRRSQRQASGEACAGNKWETRQQRQRWSKTLISLPVIELSVLRNKKPYSFQLYGEDAKNLLHWSRVRPATAIRV